MNIKLTIARVGAGLLGVIALISGGKAIWNGASSYLDDAAALGDPQLLVLLDNDFRFFAAVWLLIGVALLVGAILIHRKPDLVQVGLEAVFIGGIARVFAFSEYGYTAEVLPPIIIELVLPPVLLVLMKLGQKEHRQAQEVAA